MRSRAPRFVFVHSRLPRPDGAGVRRESYSMQTRSLFLAAVAGLSFASVWQPLVAETAWRDEPFVVTANRASQPVDRVPASVSVVTRADIERSGAADLLELLRLQAGVDLARNGGPGGQTSLFLRGTNSNHV